MRWVLRLVETDDDACSRGVDLIEIFRPEGLAGIADLALSLPEAKQLLTSVQRAVVASQARHHGRLRPDYRFCVGRCHMKDWRPHRIATLFGELTVRLPRFLCAGCRNAAKRWLARHGQALAHLRPVFLGDDLFACQPIAAAIQQAGGNFILTCKPSSHQTIAEYLHGAELQEHRQTSIKRGKRTTTFYRWLSGVPLRATDDALSVNWFSIEIHKIDDHHAGDAHSVLPRRPLYRCVSQLMGALGSEGQTLSGPPGVRVRGMLSRAAPGRREQGPARWAHPRSSAGNRDRRPR
jgi:hypothetical protein